MAMTSSDGKFSIGRSQALPPNCVKCGVRSSTWLTKKFSWHPPALYVLLFLGPLLYLIIALIVRKNVSLSVPLCAQHDEARRRKSWIGGILLVACLPLPIALANVIPGDMITGVSILLGAAMFLVGLIVLNLAAPLKATMIDDYWVEFSGAGPGFMALLPR